MPRWIRVLLLVCAALCVASPAWSQVGASPEARKQYRVGLDYLEEANPRYQEAYEAFHRAFAISPMPQYLGKIALCARNLERDGEAIAAYEQYIAEAPLQEREMVEVAKALEQLSAGSAELKLEIAPKDAEIEIVDTRTPKSGSPTVNRYQGDELKGALRLRAGDHELTIEADGYEPETLELELEAGTKVVQRLELRKLGAPEKKDEEALKPAPEPEPEEPVEEPGDGSLGAGTITLLAATGALTVGAVVVGVLALDAKANYDTYQFGGNRADAEEVRGTGELLNGLTDGLIAGAGVAAILSAVFLGLDLSDDGGAETAVAPVVGPGFVGVTGRF